MLTEWVDHPFKAAVACAEDKHGRWLLGKSTARDDRRNLWCMVGGGIKDGETPEQAAIRECHEESGMVVTWNDAALTIPAKPDVAFVYCRVVGIPEPNSEFSDMRLFTYRELVGLPLYHTVLDVIKRCM